MVVLDEEIGGNFNIDKISWQAHPSSASSVKFNNFKIYMGLYADNELGSTFEDNYVSETRTLVLDESVYEITGTPGEWSALTLDTPYTYNASEGNLVIEISWESCVDKQSFYTYSWDTGTIRSIANTVSGAQTNPTGTLSSAMSRLMLSGSSSGDLTSITFGSIKNTFR